MSENEKSSEVKVTITLSRYVSLVQSENLVEALMEEGVDNWGGYGVALSTAEGYDEDTISWANRSTEDLDLT